jgi:hypothetical protein
LKLLWIFFLHLKKLLHQIMLKYLALIISWRISMASAKMTGLFASDVKTMYLGLEKLLELLSRPFNKPVEESGR